MTQTPILEVRHLYKIFAPLDFRGEKKMAYKLLELGATRQDVLEATGMTAAVTDVSFRVGKGEIFVLIGLSGSGKSTVRCLNMLHRPAGEKSSLTEKISLRTMK